MTISEKYSKAFNSMPLDGSENPECVPFYRATYALRAVIGDDAMKKFSHFIHGALSWTKDLEDFARVAKLIKADADSRTMPEFRSIHTPFYEREPDEPDEKDVKDFFRAQFRAAFPGKRVNSKFAKEKWEERKAVAEKLVWQDYEERLAAYEARRNCHKEAVRKEREEYEERCSDIRDWQRLADLLIREAEMEEE